MLKRAIIIMLVIVSLAIIHLILQVKIMGLGYEIQKLKKNLETLVSENRSLGAIVAKEESLPRIEKIATEKLGMVKPDKLYYLKLSTLETGTSPEVY